MIPLVLYIMTTEGPSTLPNSSNFVDEKQTSKLPTPVRFYSEMFDAYQTFCPLGRQTIMNLGSVAGMIHFENNQTRVLCPIINLYC